MRLLSVQPRSWLVGRRQRRQDISETESGLPLIRRFPFALTCSDGDDEARKSP